jgi:hypothetical protein
MTLQIPTVHLNGTGKDQLLEQVCEAVHALHEAGRALAAAAPNGRDYYLQTGDAIGSAMKQHEARMTKLREIIKELETIGEGIADQG